MLAIVDRSRAERLVILSFSQVELRSAVRRREKLGEMTAEVAANLLEAFSRHTESRFITQLVTDSTLDTACALVDRHELRAYDAMQLAGYITLKSGAGNELPVFVCADRALLIAASQEGFPTLNPTLIS